MTRFPTAQAMQRALDEWLAQASPLSDSALGRIVADRLGTAILHRREQIKRSVAERASLPAMPAMVGVPHAGNPQFDLELVPTQSAGTASSGSPSGAPSALPSPSLVSGPPAPFVRSARSDLLDLQLDDMIEPSSGSSAAPVGGILPTRPSNKLPPPVGSAAPPSVPASPPTPLPTPTPSPLELQRPSYGPLAGPPRTAPPAAPPAAPPPKKQAPGFLDPAALAAARGAGARPAAAALPNANVHVYVPDSGDEGQRARNRPDLMAEALAVQREYELSAASRAGVDLVPHDDAPRGRSRLGIVVGLVALVAAVVVGLTLGAPVYARQRVLQAAQDAGISLLVGDIDVNRGGLTLHDVTVTSVMLPGVDLRGATVELTPLFDPTSLEISGGAVTASGSFDTLRAKLKAFRDAAPAVAQQRIAFDGTQLTWSGAFPDDTVLHAQSMRAESDALGGGLALHTGSLRADGPHGAFGPWGFDLQTTNDASTVRLLLDQTTPQGATITVVLPSAPASPVSLSARLARASLTHLGVTPSIFGLEPDPATQIELNVQVVGASQGRLRADVHFVLHDARPLGTATPFDIVFTAKADGGAAGPVPLVVSQLMIGPLAAHADAVISFQDGLRVDGAWHVAMTCDKLAKAAGQDTFGLGASQTPLGKLLGSAKPEGNVVVDGLFTFDTRALARTRFAPTYASTCGVSLLSKPASP